MSKKLLDISTQLTSRDEIQEGADCPGSKPINIGSDHGHDDLSGSEASEQYEGGDGIVLANENGTQNGHGAN